MNTPTHVKTKITRHEWVIGHDHLPSTYNRDFHDGILVAERQMKELGVDLSYDDAYQVRSGDGGQIVLFVDIEEDN